MTAKKSQPNSYKAARGVLPWKPGDEPAENTVARARGRGKDLPIRKMSPWFSVRLFFRKILTAMKKRIFSSHK